MLPEQNKLFILSGAYTDIYKLSMFYDVLT